MCFNNTHFAILKIQGLWRELTIKRPRAKKTLMQGARNFSLLGGKGGLPASKEWHGHRSVQANLGFVWPIGLPMGTKAN